MSEFPDFASEVMRTLDVEHDLVMALSNKVRLLEARVEQLEQKQ